MKAQSPVAARPLVLLTGGVLAVHLLALRESMLMEAPHTPVLRALVTRVVPVPPRPDAEVASPNAVAVAPMAISRAPPWRSPPESPLPSTPPPPAQATTPSEPQQVAASSVPPSSAPPSPALAFAIPGSVRLRYGVAGVARGQAWTSTGELLWRHDGSLYEAALEFATPMLRSRSLRSTGRITAEGLAPLRFSDKGRSERATHFERESETLIFSSNAPRVSLLAGTQDRLSVFLQLAAMLAAAPEKYPAGTGISLHTAGTRDAEPWLFTVDGDESLVLPGGTVTTRKLVRQPRRDYDVRVELWLGIGMDYVPVRIRLTQPNGDFVDQQWSSTDRS